ncbi:hypothetical protein PYCCODRAFT_1421633 [Trametes coccinea BRFM310]|uniref:Uncharacterized protein n=1 Tax=Trametes coccinea (strain BRFM310) TaxID=1353009 RepID=A0A1Y2J2R8_TRAC3|nr:hypothetical protein PYCCODRAFT_1421633 [Trametes coccinea BRFM310]
MSGQPRTGESRRADIGRGGRLSSYSLQSAVLWQWHRFALLLRSRADASSASMFTKTRPGFGAVYEPSSHAEAHTVAVLPGSGPNLALRTQSPLTPWTPAPDIDLDDAELDLAINGYEPADDLDDVEVGSDDFEVVGFVGLSDDEECSSDNEQESIPEAEEACSIKRSDDEWEGYAVADWPPRSEAAGSNSDDSETEADTVTDDEVLASDIECNRVTDAAPQNTLGQTPRQTSIQAATTTVQAVATRSRGDCTLKRKRHVDVRDDSDVEAEAESSDTWRPPTKRVRHGQAMKKRERMSKAQATSYWSNTDAVGRPIWRTYIMRRKRAQIVAAAHGNLWQT